MATLPGAAAVRVLLDAIQSYSSGTPLLAALAAASVAEADFRLALREYDGLLRAYIAAQEARRLNTGDDRLRE